eukprot:403344418
MSEIKPKSARVSELNTKESVSNQNKYNELGDDSHFQDPYYNQDQDELRRGNSTSISSGLNQGTQGDQMKFDISDPKGAYTRPPIQFQQSNTETRALLDVEQSRFEIYLQRLYLSPNCQYFYLGLLVVSLILVIATLVQGFKVDQNFIFIFVEFLLNALILIDFIFRVKIMGVQRFFQGSLWNKFDVFVVLGCISLFILMLISKSGNLFIFEEISEEILLIVWSVFQTLRMILYAKKQKLAQQSAKTLIDFTNVMDSEAGENTNRQGGYDEVIVFDMKQMENRQQNQLISGTTSSGLSNRKRSRGSYKQQRPTSSSIYQNHQNNYKIDDEGGIEMQDIGQSEKYKKQGLGGYEDEESLDNSGRIDLDQL